MYNNISNDAKTALKSRVVTTTARITLTSNNQVIDGNNLVNVTITDQCYQDGVIVGTAMAKEVEIELIDNNYDLADKEFSLEVGVLLPNNSYEYIPYGNFIVKDYQKIISSNHYRLIAYDYMDKFNSTFVDNNSTLEDGVTYTTPMTLQSFYQYVANQFGVSIQSQSNLPNANFSITTKPYFDGMSGRTVISRIAEMMGCFAKINRSNKIEMRLKTTTSEKFSRNEMNNSLERDNRFGPINVISLRLSQVEGENVTKRDESSISQYGETTLQIQDNPFCYTEALRLAAINAIYNKVDGFSYYPTTFNGKLIYLDAGDEVEVQDMETDTYYKTIILKQVLKIPSTRNSKFENKALTDTGLQHQFTPEQVRKDRRTEYLVDKQNGVIQQIVETTEEIEREFETLQDIDGFAEGKYIYLDDASDELITSAKFNGETSQETRSGKNIFNKDATVTGAANTTKTVLSTGVRIQQSVTGTYRAIVFNLGGSELLGKTLTIKATVTPSASNIGAMGFFFGSSGSSAISRIGNMMTASGTQTVTIPSSFVNNADRINLLLYSNYTGTGNEGDYVDYTNLQVEIGSQATSYEQYGVMPSPDYPSEIENVEGRNIFDKDTANILNAYLSGGKVITSSANDRTIYIPCKANTTYTLSKMVQQTTANNRLALAYSSNLPTLGGSFTERVFLANGTTQTSLSITTDSNAKYLLAYIYYQDTNTTFEEILDSIQIEEGTVATSYAPYNSLEVKVVNKNIFNEEQLLEANNWTKNNEGFYTGTIGNLHLMYSSNNGGFKFPFKFKENTQYTLSLEAYSTLGNNNSRFQFVYTDGTISSPGNFNYTTSHKISGKSIAGKTIKNISTNYSNTGSDVIYIKNIQLEENEETDYETYQEQIVYFPLAEGQKLYEGSYLADDGIHNVRGQIVLDGTETGWYDAGGGAPYTFPLTNLKRDNNEVMVLSNYFMGVSYSSNWNSYNALISTNASTATPSKIKFKYTGISSLADFKTWLSTHNTLVEYELAEEEIIPYNIEQQAAWNSIRELHTYKTVTHIYSDAYAEIGYIKDNMLSAFETKASAQLTKNDVAQLKIENGRISSEVSSTQSQFNNYYTKNEADNNTNSTKAELQNIIQQNKTEIEQTTQAINLRVSSIETNGVDKIETSMGYTFNNEGLNIDKEGAATASTIDNEAFKVKNKSANENVFFAGYVSDQDSAYRGQTIVESTNLVVKNYLNIEGASRFQPYVNPVLGGHGTGAFDIG